MKATVLRPVALVVRFGLAAALAAGMSTVGCTNGTTPVCDDAGSCLILPPGGEGGTPPATDAGPDAPAE
jgi:hypothetical protein